MVQLRHQSTDPKVNVIIAGAGFSFHVEYTEKNPKIKMRLSPSYISEPLYQFNLQLISLTHSSCQLLSN